MKRLAYTIFCLFLSMAILAVPARMAPFKLRLVDGSCVTACLCGDEHFAWMQTTDGRLLEETAEGYRLSEQSLDELLRQREATLESDARLKTSRRRIGSQATAPLPSTGSPRVPVILVEFQDSVFHVGNTPEEIRHYYDLYCNGTRDGNRYTAHGSYGAVRDYFVAQSEGQFQPEFEIIGPVRLSQNESYYGGNTGGPSTDKNYDGFVKEAVQLATQSYDGNWSDFCYRGDDTNSVGFVFFIYAGCGEANGGPSSTIWPKESVNSTSVKLDDETVVSFSTSACCNENRASLTDDAGNVLKSTPDGIGIMCHELCHGLGLPDFYDYGLVGFGMDVWSVMDYGEYMGNGYNPVALTAYERDFMGWRSLQTLDQPQWLTLQPIDAGGYGYKIVNNENPNEYYILESRQKAGWDSRLAGYGHGLQVTHVDYASSPWNGNRVNSDANRQRCTIVAANNRYIGSTMLNNGQCTFDDMRKTWRGNLYPYRYTDGAGVEQCNDSLTAYSVPAATVYTAGKFLHKDIHAIRENEDLSMTLYFGNDYVDAIKQLPAAVRAQDEALYDLSGRRLNGARVPKAGLYISRSGRKMLIR